MFAFGLTIFTGAFLLFLVQPLIGKFILPWFGGTPAVWTTCMLFFQVLLLGGYAYAHFSISRLKPRKQVVLHLAVLAAALLLLPITPSDFWKPPDSTSPVWRILVLLGASLGLPYLVLSATGPLMQAWFSQTSPKVSPYRLYALSNVGSLLALISYPFLVEPNFSRQTQAVCWSIGLGVFAALAGWCGWKVWKSAKQNEPVAKGDSASASAKQENPTPIGAKLLWFALPACGSILLLAVTNKICQDIAAVPFLWVLPLSLYLLSFIISFDHQRWYWRPLWLPLFVITMAVALWVMLGRSLYVEESWIGSVKWLLKKGGEVSIFNQIGIFLTALFASCMVCHGEVYRLRPTASRLTNYYLMISAGGAFGGLFVAVAAPLLFDRYVELHIGLFILAMLVIVVLFVDGKSFLRKGRLKWAWASLIFLALVGSGSGFYADAHSRQKNAVELSRNFYGALRVSEYDVGSSEWHKFYLVHGVITHGFQFVSEHKRRLPTTYFSFRSGVGRALVLFSRQTNRRVGVVGLGAGTLAAYGKEGDYFRFYEINEDVIRLANSRFTYLKDSAAKTDVVLGDARLSLEREESQQFDVLALDAFSSDAIPIHLLTREAFEIYERHLKPDGVIAVHISNLSLNLRPIVLRAAEHFGFTALILDTRNMNLDRNEETRVGAFGSTWMLLSKNLNFLAQRGIADVVTAPEKIPPDIKMWTDDQSDIFRILIFPK